MIKTNVVELQNAIIEQPSYIADILEKLHFDNIKDRGKYIQFSNHGGDNMQACSIYKDSLKYINFSHGVDGNLFTLVEDEKKCNFPRALELIAGWIGIKCDSDYHINYPFHSFYKDILKAEKSPEEQIKSYDYSLLPPDNNFSLKFLKDGISLLTQQEFGVRYSHQDDAILIPICFNNKLIGCKARANSEVDYSHRWWAYLEYPKSLCVYGFDRNYNTIIHKKTVIIAESEKAVMQAASMGLNCVLAIAGCNISRIQEKYIKSLMADNIIVAFDEDRNPDQLEYECKKLQVKNLVYSNKVGFIYDKEHKYLSEKMSPFDGGKEMFKNLRKECIEWL